MKDLEGYFNNLAVAVINNKSVLEQQVANNAKLAATNENLVAIVKQLSNEIKNIKRETYCLKKTGVIPHCKKEGYNSPDACFELSNNKNKRPTGWKSWL